MEQMVINVVELCRPKSGSSISPDMDIQRDLEFESLDMMMLGTELEAAFDIAIKDSDFKEIKTVGDLINHIKKVKN